MHPSHKLLSACLRPTKTQREEPGDLLGLLLVNTPAAALTAPKKGSCCRIILLNRVITRSFASEILLGATCVDVPEKTNNLSAHSIPTVRHSEPIHFESHKCPQNLNVDTTLCIQIPGQGPVQDCSRFDA